MKKIRSKYYKTNYNNPTGLARCDRCGMAVNGDKLIKYMEYTGTPHPDYDFEAKYMQQGDVMGNGNIQWNGWMVCKKCVDTPHPQSNYHVPPADPVTADGNRPMPNILSYGNQVLSSPTNPVVSVFFTDPDEDPIGV